MAAYPVSSDTGHTEDKTVMNNRAVAAMMRRNLIAVYDCEGTDEVTLLFYAAQWDSPMMGDVYDYPCDSRAEEQDTIVSDIYRLLGI
jgi:hypothetical protein